MISVSWFCFGGKTPKHFFLPKVYWEVVLTDDDEDGIFLHPDLNGLGQSQNPVHFCGGMRKVHVSFRRGGIRSRISFNQTDSKNSVFVSLVRSSGTGSCSVDGGSIPIVRNSVRVS